MNIRISILYSWFVRTLTYFFPNLPIIMRFRGFLYSFMMKNCGKNFQVHSSVYLNSLAGLYFGNDVYIGPGTIFIAVDVTVEDEVLIGPNNVISGGNHTFDGNSFRFAPSRGASIIIKRGSWVSSSCTILTGSILPNKSILAAGAVLNSEFNIEGAIYGGIPAKFIKLNK